MFDVLEADRAVSVPACSEADHPRCRGIAVERASQALDGSTYR